MLGFQFMNCTVVMGLAPLGLDPLIETEPTIESLTAAVSI